MTPTPGAPEPDPTRIIDPGSEVTAVSDGRPPGVSTTRVTRGHGLVVQGLGSLVGTTWGDFALGDLLGRGGMGAVYRGRQLSLDRAVAIKVLPPELAEVAEYRERFLREARAIAQVASPHIVQVFFAGSHNGWHFYVMELVEGQDLARRLRDGWRPDAATARDLVLQAARGLATAARWGIVHRDIKPANMLLTAEGCLKISDFGLVRRSGEHQLTSQGLILGTAGYLSPEQALGQPCDARSDLYSLGVVLYELLAGRTPFVAESAAGVIYQHIHEEPRPLAELLPDLDPATAAICARLLAKRPEDRYQSAADLVGDLEAAASGAPLRHTTVHRRKRRGSGRLVIAIVATVLAAAGIATWAMHRHHAAAEAAARIAAASAAQTAKLQAEAQARAAATAAAAAAEARHHDAWGRFSDLAVPGANFRLREIPPGKAMIGSPADEAGRSRDEVQATVTFTRTMWIGDSEITQGQWKAVLGEPPRQDHPGDDLPVTGISRAQAESFCARLEALAPGLAGRLPTEAEWERAARAGAAGPWAGDRPLATQAWYAGNAGGGPHPARQFPPNPWGLYDVHGNVAEWTADAYAARSGQALTDPAPAPGDRTVFKGGAWDDDPDDCRLARRDYARGPGKRIGFRIVATALPPAIR